jgi:predicted aspartyl protease
VPRAATARIADGARSTPPIPLNLLERRWMFVQGRVNGLESELLLDSGAGITTLSTTFAARAGVAGAGALDLQGITAAQQAALAPGVEVVIGPLTMSDVTVLITDLRSVERSLGRPVDVIVGKELFNSVVVEIDYPASTVMFHDPRSYRPDRAARPLRLLAGGAGGKMVEASVEGLPPAPFALDTGAGSAVTIFKPYADQHGILDNRLPRSERLMSGVGGAAVTPLATLRSFTLGGYELRSVPAEFDERGGGAFNTQRIAGNLGADLLRRFRVVLDYSRDRMYLTPGPGWDSVLFCKNRAGIQAEYRGIDLEVVFVLPGSPAARAGWKAGERIVAIDHQPIDERYLRTGAEWACGAVGSTVRLTDGAGMERVLVLAEYY